MVIANTYDHGTHSLNTVPEATFRTPRLDIPLSGDLHIWPQAPKGHSSAPAYRSVRNGAPVVNRGTGWGSVVG
jgi:hypothetical protein